MAILNKSPQVVRKAEGSTESERVVAVESGKPKKAARAWCWKGFLLKSLKTTGVVMATSCTSKYNFSCSETLILPGVTFLGIAIYVGLAISFYNSD